MTAVLVHGAWHGAWCWDPVLPLLTERGVPAIALDLPLTSLSDDAAAVRAVLDGVDGTAVLVGHSYGGAVITEAGVHDAVAHLVYLSAFQLDAGETVLGAVPDRELPSTEIADVIHFGDDGVTKLDVDRVGPVFFNDCSPAVVADAAARLRPMALACISASPAEIAWRDRPSTYVVCTDDQGVHPELQRAMAERASADIEWPTSHSPFLSRPELVADLVASIANGVSP